MNYYAHPDQMIHPTLRCRLLGHKWKGGSWSRGVGWFQRPVCKRCKAVGPLGNKTHS